MCRLNPRIDFVFKKLFGTEGSKDILADLINSIVSEADRVSELEIKNPYNEKEFLEQKGSVLDIKAKSVEGKWYDIEMQVLSEDWFAKRSLYYWSGLYRGQIEQGVCYSELRKAICINILNFDHLDNEPSYHNVYKVKNVASGEELLDEFEIHFIELRKYDETLADSLSRAIDRWVHFLKLAGRYDSESMPEELKATPSVSKAMHMLERLTATKEEREIYEARERWFMDLLSTVETKVRRSREEGLEEGKEIGKAEGIEETRRENALRMLRDGLNVANAAKYSGLSEEEVRRLAEETPR